MSTKRRGSTTFDAFWPKRDRTPDGREGCRYCGRPLAPPRRDWCSASCRSKALQAFSLANDPAYQRRAVWQRDRGRCAQCGRDTRTLRDQLKSADGPARELLYHTLLREGYDRHRLDALLLWEMDHLHPVAEGGGGTGLDNLQTLCIPCHKQKTAAQLRQRRAARQGLRNLFDEQA